MAVGGAVSNRLARRTLPSALTTIDADGSNASKISHTGGLLPGQPSWSLDGSRIAYTSNPQGRYSLYVVRSAGGESLRLPIGDFEAGAPAWSHDGHWIYFRCERSGSSQICGIAADGSSRPVQITKGGGVEGFESADGTRLYFLRSHDYGALLTVPVSGGPERELAGSPTVKAGFWTCMRNGIYFLDVGQSQKGGESIPVKRFDPTTRGLEVLGLIGEASGTLKSEISVRPDGKEIAWCRYEHGADLMLLDNFR